MLHTLNRAHESARAVPWRVSVLAFCSLASFCNPTWAQSQIYKQVLPDGGVIYTDKPDPKARTEKKIQPEFKNFASRRSSTSTPAQNSDAAPAASFSPGVPGTPVGALPSLPPLPGSAYAPSSAPAPKPASVAVPPASKAGALDKAQAEYDSAVAALEGGKAPQAGERSANVNGSIRINENYAIRQSKLNDDVRQSLEQLEKARSGN